jgi:4-amino-4-deoxy-L-arabinose transferase-like glycosyltransferase
MLNFKFLSKNKSFLLTLLEVVIVLILLAFSFVDVRDPRFSYWDESTNIAVVIESGQTNSYLPLQFHSEPFYEKPPLYYWIGMSITSNFGNSVYNLKLINAFSTAALLILIYFFIRKESGIGAGIFTLGLLLGSSALWQKDVLGLFHTHTLLSIDLDNLHILFLAIALILVYHFSRSQKKMLLGFAIGIAAGLAFMVKGPLALLPLGFLSVIAWREKSLKALLLAIASFLIIILPWHILSYLQGGDRWISEYVLYHQLLRISDALEGHGGPIYFHLIHLLDPRYSFAAIGAVIIALLKPRKFKLNLFLIAAGIFLIIISLMQTKLSWYVLPVIVFICIGIGLNFKGVFNKYLLLPILGLISIAVFFNFLNLHNMADKHEVQAEVTAQAK